ncbi:MAG: aspartate aminotransferase family protein [Holophagaceae bacterium]|nr:aspartate aminotransferase family protein [Holophagaceae bacterium]
MTSILQPALLPTYAPFPFTLASGAGDRVFTTDGEAYWDFYGGHCVASTGHSHPAVVAALAAQAAELIFYSTAGELRVRNEAAEALVAFAQGSGTASVFFCNSGAEANENALLLAAKLTGRTSFAAFQGGWHGRTLLARSVSDDPKLHAGLKERLAPTAWLPFGDEAILQSVDFTGTAAVIVEPIQSMSGIRTAPASFFRALREKCTASGTLLIFDEVQTGVGRLGKPFAAEFYGVRPDFITSAKGLASGVPIGALLMTADIAAQVKAGDLGSTFGGGPLAAAALLATLQVIQDEGLMARATACAARLREGLQGSVVSKVRGEGLLLGLEAGAEAAALKRHLEHRHILVGASTDPAVLRLMPPLNLSDAALDALLTATHAFRKGH